MERRLLILVHLNAVPDQVLVDGNQPLASKEQLWNFFVVLT
jgi:hypothetical protein